MTKLLTFISTPFRWLGKLVSFARNLVFNLLFLLLVLAIATSLFFDKKTIIKDKSALILTIAGNVVEEKKDIDPIGEFLNESLDLDEFPSEVLLQDILDVIHYASRDDKITCLVLKLKKMGNIGLNQLEVIGEALQLFKDRGKQVIAADDSYLQKQYYLASYANKIFINPAGFIDIKGFSFYRLYLREALEKLKINFHVVRVGDYKSAVEVFTRDSMSSNARKQNRMWLSSLWTNFTSQVTSQRSLPPESLDNLANSIATKLAETNGDSALLALQSGLVDEIQTRSEVRTYLATLSSPDSVHDFRQVSFRNYLKTVERSYQIVETTKDKVGLIVASGNIVDGKRQTGTIGGDSLSNTIRRAKRDKSIKAVVLRINSGGGSLFASETIRHEILELKKMGKPFIVSMSTLAASGGYLISSDSDEIWASPVSLTGSIGIFGVVPTFENSLTNLGVQSDGIGTTNIASANNLTRPLSPILKEAMQLKVNHGYDRFLTIVSKGRKIDKSSLEYLAQGKVYTGKKAQELGLIDKLGTLQDAIKSAAHKAGLKDYSVQYVARTLTFKEKLFNQFSTTIASFFKAQTFSQPLVKRFYTMFAPLREIFYLDDPSGLYAHCIIADY